MAEALVPVVIEWARSNADPSVICSGAHVCAPDELLQSPEQVGPCDCFYCAVRVCVCVHVGVSAHIYKDSQVFALVQTSLPSSRVVWYHGVCVLHRMARVSRHRCLGMNVRPPYKTCISPLALYSCQALRQHKLYSARESTGCSMCQFVVSAKGALPCHCAMITGDNTLVHGERSVERITERRGLQSKRLAAILSIQRVVRARSRCRQACQGTVLTGVPGPAPEQELHGTGSIEAPDSVPCVASLVFIPHQVVPLREKGCPLPVTPGELREAGAGGEGPDA
eukprot:1160063-Pelagomonas_calceolata.AAC.3